MSKFTNFSLSVDKGFRGNIGSIADFTKSNGDVIKRVMLYLVPNGEVNQDEQSSQIVNVDFPQEAFEDLAQYSVGDYIRVYYSRIDFAKGISKKTGQEVLYITAKANGVNLLKKAEKKEASKPQVQRVSSGWHRQQTA